MTFTKKIIMAFLRLSIFSQLGLIKDILIYHEFSINLEWTATCIYIWNSQLCKKAKILCKLWRMEIPCQQMFLTLKIKWFLIPILTTFEAKIFLSMLFYLRNKMWIWACAKNRLDKVSLSQPLGRNS